jgi:hypothetical protein
MARKDLIEAVAAMSDSAARMGGEPVSARRGLEEMTTMLIAVSVFVAHVSAVRLDLKKANEPAPPERLSDIEATRKWLANRLVSSAPAPVSPNAPLPRTRRSAEALIAAANAFAAAASGG